MQILLLLLFAVCLYGCQKRKITSSSRLLRTADMHLMSIRDRMQSLLEIMIDQANAFSVKGSADFLRVSRPIDAVYVPLDVELAKTMFRQTVAQVGAKWRESLKDGTAEECQTHLNAPINRALLWWAANSVNKSAESLHLWSRDKVKADEAVQNATRAVESLRECPEVLDKQLAAVAQCVKLAFAYWSLAAETILRRRSEIVDALDDY